MTEKNKIKRHCEICHPEPVEGLMNRSNFILFFKRFYFIAFGLISLTGFSQTDTIARLYTFGGINNDNAEEIEATADGGYIVIGSTSSNSSGNTDAYLLKVDSMCNYEWSKALGGSNNDWGYSIKQTFDKGFIIATSSNSYGNGGYDAVLMKRDSLGGFVWKKTYGGPDWDFAYSVVQTYDSGYVFCGETYNNTNGYSDVYIVKTNPLGDTLWTRTLGGALVDKGNCVIETSDSNIVVAGITNTVTDSTDIYVIKLTPNGTLLWDSIYGNTGFEYINQVIEASNGNYIMAGNTTSSSVGGDQDYLIKSIDLNGIFLWDFISVNGPSPTPDDEDAFAIQELSNNNILISGYSKTGGNNKNIIFFQLQLNGSWAGVSSVIGTNNDDFVRSVAIGNNLSIVGAGTTLSFGSGLEDLLLIKLDTIYVNQDISITIYEDNTPLSFREEILLQNINIYPNPVFDFFFISSKDNFQMDRIDIYDIAGKNVFSESISSPLVYMTNLNAGVYFINLSYKSQIYYQTKIIKY